MIKPILFNTDMVRAILDGRKTITRRLVKPQPDEKHQMPLGYITSELPPCGDLGKFAFGIDEFGGHLHCVKPPYHPGDILYVRETWHKDINRFMYRADYGKNEKFYRNGKEVQIKWQPSIHMPKEAARIWLKVKDVRVELLQEITEKQSEDEGCIYDVEYCVGATARAHFKELWNSTIKKSELDRYGWDANPWVWVIEFERIELE